MPLQTAIDICQDIREQFPHVLARLHASDRLLRDGSTAYFISVSQGQERSYKRSWVLNSVWDWDEFLLLFSIFANR